MKKTKSVILLITVTLFVALLISGCSGVIPNNSSTSSDPGYDEANTVVSYFKVTPAKVEMKVNQSQKFEAKGYNSNNKLVKIDLSKIEWRGEFECRHCGIVWKLTPSQNSRETTFTPLKKGNYKIWVKYEFEGITKWANAVVVAK